MTQNSFLTWLCVLTAALSQNIAHGKMVIRTSQNYYTPNHFLEVNCTSSVEVKYNFIEISMNLNQVAAIVFVRSNGTCNIVKNNVELVECRHECRCTLDGKSAAWAFNVTTDYSNFTLGCSASGLFDSIVIRKAILVTRLTLHPTGRNNEVPITIGKNQTFTCTTDSSRPASWIHWYFDNTNVTNQAKIVVKPDVTDNTTYVSASTFVYTGQYKDNFNVIYCKAANVNGRQEIKSAEKTLLIEGPISISGSAVHAVISKPFTITCSGLSNNLAIIMRTNDVPVAVFTGAYQNNTCKLAGSYFTSYTFRCYNDSTILSYSTTIPGRLMAETLHLTVWKCNNPFTKVTDFLTLEVDVPITTVTINQDGDNNIINITNGTKVIFTCSTNTGRPAAFIEWYIGDQNVTDQASLQTFKNGTKFMTSSTLVLTGRETDHNKVVYCEASNIEGRKKIKSNNRTLDIQVPLKALTLTPVGISNVVTVVSGMAQEFTCRTDSSRPPAWINWYIGERNVTNHAISQPPQKNGTKYMSSSKLVYTGSAQENNEVVYCEAANIQGMQKIQSANRTLLIVYRPDPVVEMLTICDVACLVVMWRSEFNGGNKQTFQVVWQNINSGVETRSDKVPDPGVGSIVHYSKMSSTKSYYTVIIESTNIYGTVRSNKKVYCNISGTVVALPVTESALSFSAGVGSGAALIVIINIVAIAVVFILRARRRVPADGSKIYEDTKHKPEDANVYNELNETPKGTQLPTDSCDRTYEDIRLTANQLANTDNSRKKKGKTK